MKKRSILAIILCLCTIFSALSIVTFSASAAKTVSINGVLAQAKCFVDCVEINHRLPNNGGNEGSVTFSNSEFLYLAAKTVIALNNGTRSGNVTVNTVGAAKNPAETLSGKFNMDKSAYLDLCNRVIKFADNNKLAANYYATAKGNIRYENAVYTISRALYYFKNNSARPNYVTVHTWANIVKGNFTKAPTAAPKPFNGSSTPATPTTPSTPAASKTVTMANVITASQTFVDYIEANKKLPASATAGSVTITAPEFLYLGAKTIIALHNGTKSGNVTVNTINAAANPVETLTGSRNMYTAAYIDLCNRIIKFADNNKLAANYYATSNGNIRYENAVYTIARLAFYCKNNSNTLPNYVLVQTWANIQKGNFTKAPRATSSSSSSSSSGTAQTTFAKEVAAAKAKFGTQYLRSTSNCPVGNATLTSVAKTATAGATSLKDAAKKLVNYLNQKTNYDGYMNTRRGALKTWNDRKGNCCDMAHMCNACARSIGIPGRYRHATCRFRSGTVVGHVWAEFWTGSAWQTVDIVNAENYLGYKSNVNLTTPKIYESLPF